MEPATAGFLLIGVSIPAILGILGWRVTAVRKNGHDRDVDFTAAAVATSEKMDSLHGRMGDQHETLKSMLTVQQQTLIEIIKIRRNGGT